MSGRSQKIGGSAIPSGGRERGRGGRHTLKTEPTLALSARADHAKEVERQRMPTEPRLARASGSNPPERRASTGYTRRPSQRRTAGQVGGFRNKTTPPNTYNTEESVSTGR